MTDDDQIRDAFRDLSDRVAREIDPAVDPAGRPSGPATARSGLLSRPGLAIAGLVVAAGVGAAAITLAGDDDDQQVATDSTTSSSTTDDVTASTADDGSDGDGTGSTTEPTDDDPGDDDPAGADRGQRLRVDTELVSADADDPFLNVRADPDARSDLAAKLPANYTGLLATGRAETAEDGGSWLEVELLHPVAVAEFALGDDRRPTGWVNEAFVSRMADGLAVGREELAACAGGGDGSGVGGRLGSGHVYAIESAFLGSDCLRVILTYGTGQAPIGWVDLPADTGPASAVAPMTTMSSGGFGTSIDLGSIASTWSGATETDDGVFLARAADGTIDLITPAPSHVVAMTAVPEIGAVVVDLRITGEAPPAGAGTIEGVGISRPFEAVLGASVEDDSGREVEAVFSGNAQIGTRETTGYGVATTDWVEAWGTFALRVEGLAAGDHTLVLNAEDAADEPEVLRLPFSLDSGGERPAQASVTEQEAAMALHRFATGGDVADVPLADEVVLLLGPAVKATTPASELVDPGAWTIDEADGFGGFEGPFNALSALDTNALRFTAGPVPHCAGPPRDWPSELDGLRQVNIEPVGIDSCIAWFGVHLFLDGDDRIAAVAYDLFGP